MGDSGEGGMGFWKANEKLHKQLQFLRYKVIIVNIDDDIKYTVLWKVNKKWCVNTDNDGCKTWPKVKFTTSALLLTKSKKSYLIASPISAR